MKGTLVTIDEKELASIIRSEVASVLKEQEKRQKPTALPTPIAREFYTAKETAERLRISKVTLWRYEKDGILKARRVGRRVLYDRESVDSIGRK